MPSLATAAYLSWDRREDIRRDEVLIYGDLIGTMKKPGGTPLQLTRISQASKIKEIPWGLMGDFPDDVGILDPTEVHTPAVEYLAYLLKSLPRQERNIIKAYFLRGRNWEAISRKEGITIEEVRKYAMLAMTKLRQTAKKMKFAIN